MNREISIVFVDFSKAFDSINIKYASDFTAL